jgi:HD superfamily phosphohydrolase
MSSEDHRVIRDPLWNTIRVDPTAIRIIDTPAFQRLRYIRQLGLAHLVYPGATHTRFDHAVGVYHLTRTALRLLRERGGVPEEVWAGAELIPYAGLLHDIGHYAFSHALEELEPDRMPGDHEEVSVRFFESSELREALEDVGPDAASRIFGLIRGTSPEPLSGLVSGSLDLDKMEYLRRDALFCGVPYGEVDVDRLTQGLTVIPDPVSGRYEIGVDEKALSALESLLFAKYQMFRNVYWHHGVRAATALYKRIVDDAVGCGLLAAEELIGPTDEALLYEIGRRARVSDLPEARRLSERWLPALWGRRLPKRALELNAAEIGSEQLPSWITSDPRRRRRVEDAWAAELGLEPGEVFIDFPAKKKMFQLDVLVRRRSGQIERLTSDGLPGLIDLPRVADELYRSTRVLRVFTLERREINAADALARLQSDVL